MSRLRHNRILRLLFFCAVAVVLTCTFRQSKSRFIRHVTLSARRHESIEYSMNPLVLLLGSPITAQANKASSLIQPRDGAWDTVVDAGAFDAVDYTIPAFQNGYNVYSFEFDRKNQQKALDSLVAAGLHVNRDYTVIDVVPGKVPTLPRKPAPHIYFFKCGVSNVNGGYTVRPNAELGADIGEGMEVGHPDSSAAALPTVRLDDVIPIDAKIYILKMDIQGHEPLALEGATRILQRHASVRMVSLEWWPAGMVKHGVTDGGLAALRRLYEHGATCYDLGTHRHYNHASRPSPLDKWTEYLLHVPRSGPNGDPLGGWDDIVCTFNAS